MRRFGLQQYQAVTACQIRYTRNIQNIQETFDEKDKMKRFGLQQYQGVTACQIRYTRNIQQKVPN